MSKRQIQEIAVGLMPKPDVKDAIRKLSSLFQGSSSREPEATREFAKTSDSNININASKEFKEKLQKVRDLMRHQCQNGELEKIFGKALDLLLERELKKKTGKTLKPRNMKIKTKNTRSIPVEVKRKVWERDQGQCQFKSAKGQPCGATGFFQFDHIRSYAKGGSATINNIQILCANHNRLKAEREFGPGKFHH